MLRSGSVSCDGRVEVVGAGSGSAVANWTVVAEGNAAWVVVVAEGAASATAGCREVSVNRTEFTGE